MAARTASIREKMRVPGGTVEKNGLAQAVPEAS